MNAYLLSVLIQLYQDFNINANNLKLICNKSKIINYYFSKGTNFRDITMKRIILLIIINYKVNIKLFNNVMNILQLVEVKIWIFVYIVMKMNLYTSQIT